jgi:hypothetical protein
MIPIWGTVFGSGFGVSWGGRPSDLRSLAARALLALVWRAPSSASLPSPRISAAICLAVPMTVSFVLT